MISPTFAASKAVAARANKLRIRDAPSAKPAAGVCGFAARSAPVLAKIGNASLLLFFVLLIALNVRLLLGVLGSGAILVAVLYFAGLFIIGWLLGGSKPEVRVSWVSSPPRAISALRSFPPRAASTIRKSPS